MAAEENVKFTYTGFYNKTNGVFIRKPEIASWNTLHEVYIDSEEKYNEVFSDFINKKPLTKSQYNEGVISNFILYFVHDDKEMDKKLREALKWYIKEDHIDGIEGDCEELNLEVVKNPNP